MGKKGHEQRKIYVEQLPIIIANHEKQKPLIEYANDIVTKTKDLQKEIKSFHKYMISDFNVSKINKKLFSYYDLSFEEVYKEVQKQYKDINRKEKDKLEKEYLSSMDIIQPLKMEINSIDNEIISWFMSYID